MERKLSITATENPEIFNATFDFDNTRLIGLVVYDGETIYLDGETVLIRPGIRTTIYLREDLPLHQRMIEMLDYHRRHLSFNPQYRITAFCPPERGLPGEAQIEHPFGGGWVIDQMEFYN